MMPYLLRDMLIPHYHQMLGEDGIWIDLYVVHPALASFEFEVELLRWPVVRTKEAPACGNGFRRGIRSGRYESLRVMLNFAGQSEDLYILGLVLLESTKVRGCQRPDGKLVLDEFI